MASVEQDPASDSETKTRLIQFEHSHNLSKFLRFLNVSVLISTYQAGKVVALSPGNDAPKLKFLNFDRPMGMAISGDQIAIGTRNQIWFLQSAPDIARRAEPAGSYDRCYLVRRSHVTGDIQGHELGFAGGELWLVNTLFSCLCTLDDRSSFVPRWKPSFISEIVSEDRCHLNGLALENGRPKLVTALGATDSERGWRPDKADGGRLIDVPSGEVLASGLCMPHSPRLHNGQIWYLDSGRGHLVRLTRTGQPEVVASLPGYTRGLAFFEQYAFVGLSRIRETSTFGGLPIAAERDNLRCGLWIVDLSRGETILFLDFKTGVEEIFDVQILPDTRSPLLQGPSPAGDDAPEIWTAPPLSADRP